MGSFELESLAGHGAFADVWLGRHYRYGYPAAIKIPRDMDKRSAALNARFLREVQSTAQLGHAGVIQIWEHGRLARTLTPTSENTYQKETPYFVMEWLDGGTLRDALEQINWATLRGSLLLILDALAAAHARGIIHRDIKPDNILLSSRGPVLTDFGIAFDAEEGVSEFERSKIVGTPTYMAPEQIRRDFSALGPWTDLYALGCLTYIAVTGRRPFSGRTFSDVAHAHLKNPMPPLKPRFAVPNGLEDWIGKLLRKSPHRRYQFAADAALGLLKIEDDISVVLKATDLADESQDNSQVTRDTLLGSTLATAPSFLFPKPKSTLVQQETPDVPKMSSSWTSSDQHETPKDQPQPGLGRSLFAWSNAHFVGRETERDRLWSALRWASEHKKLHVIGLFGEAGMGKSSLARWLGERAHATGVAQPLKIVHEMPNGPLCGLSGLLQRTVRCAGLSNDETLSAIAGYSERAGLNAYLHAYEGILLAHSAGSSADTDGPKVAVNERYEAMARLLSAEARIRPVVLMVDDLQWGGDALGFLEYLIERWDHLPVLVITTVRSDLVDTHHNITRAMTIWSHLGCADSIHLKPMAREVMSKLVTNRLALDDDALAEILNRTHGNPLFLESLLNHWIQDGALVTGRDGFRLKGGVELNLPESINRLWDERLSSLTERNGLTWQSLELAATLGLRVEPSEWEEACKAAGLDYDPDTLVQLELGELIDNQGAGGWSFSHVLLRDFLSAHATRSGRSTQWHALCAQSLQSLKPQSHERIGVHWLESGASKLAAERLEAAVLEYSEKTDYRAMKRVLMRQARALRKSGFKINSEAWQLMAVRWQHSQRASGHIPHALRQARLSVQRSRQANLKEALAKSLLEYSMGLWNTGERQASIEMGQEACAVALKNGDLKLHARCNVRLGAKLAQLSRHDMAESCLRAAMVFCEGNPALKELYIDAIRSLAICRTEKGDFAGADQLAGMILAGSTGLNNRWARGMNFIVVGEIRRKLGQFDEAKTNYEKAVVEFKHIGNIDQWVAEINIAITLNQEGEWQAAQDAALDALATANKYQVGEGQLASHSVLALSLIHLDQMARLDETFEHIREKGSSFADTQSAQLMTEAAHALTEKQEFGRASEAWELAIGSYELGGHTDRAQWARSQLEKLKRLAD